MILLLLACRPPPHPPGLLPTGWFSDTATPGAGCGHEVAETSPDAGDDAWFHRDPLVIRTTSADVQRYAFQIVGPAGLLVPFEQVSVDGGFALVPSGPLSPDADHTLVTLDCATRTEIPFRTSELGLPLSVDPASLRDRTYALDLRGARWNRPNGVGPLLSLYFDAPVLVGVRTASPSRLQLVMTIGLFDADGNAYQDPVEPVFAFPPLVFSDSPAFAATMDRFPLTVAGVSLPVEGFAFSGTFSPDGTRIGGGRVTGLADTRYAGPLLSSSAEDRICRFAEGLGITCVPCSDGEPFCLDLEVAEVTATELPGRVLRE